MAVSPLTGLQLGMNFVFRPSSRGSNMEETAVREMGIAASKQQVGHKKEKKKARAFTSTITPAIFESAKGCKNGSRCQSSERPRLNLKRREETAPDRGVVGSRALGGAVPVQTKDIYAGSSSSGSAVKGRGFTPAVHVHSKPLQDKLSRVQYFYVVSIFTLDF